MQARELFKLLRKNYKLSNNEIILYYEIYSIYFYGGKLACYASNEYFETELGISAGTIKRALKHLQKEQLIDVRYRKKNGFLTERNIYPLHEKTLFIQAKEIEKTREQKIKERPEELPCEDHTKVQNEPCTAINLNDNSDQNDHQIYDLNLRFKSINNDISGSKISADALVVTSNDDILIKDKWNKIAKKYGLATITTLTQTRKKHFKQRCIDAGSEEMFFRIIENALSASEFLRGNNQKRWKANFDFFLRQSSFVKSAEGAYNFRCKTAPVVKAVTGESDEITAEDLYNFMRL